MYNTSSHFHVSCFRHRVVTCLLLTIFSFSFLTSLSFAQQPTATIKTLSGIVLVSGQTATVGAVLQVGETIQIQAWSSAALELSDGSEIHLDEKTEVIFTELTQTAAGARVSSLKLSAGRVRAFLSGKHQHKGSAFTVETPNARIDAAFSQPDIEVSYSLGKAETVGIAHTVKLMAKNLATNEEVLVPIGATVIITSEATKVVAGMLGTKEVRNAKSEKTGMSTGTKVALGVGVAAAVAGAVALASDGGNEGGSSNEGDSTGGDSPTAESTGNLSGIWNFDGSCVAKGCTEDIPCWRENECCGTAFCDCCTVNWYGQVTRTGNTLSGVHLTGEIDHPLSGIIDGNSVSITIAPDSLLPTPNNVTNYTGVIDGNTIRGTFSGSGYIWTPSGNVSMTWTGTFTVTIQK